MKKAEQYITILTAEILRSGDPERVSLGVRQTRKGPAIDIYLDKSLFAFELPDRLKHREIPKIAHEMTEYLRRAAL